MKTKNFWGCLAALSMALHASAQVAWDTNGNTATGTDWFGADNSSTIPLQIRNDANQPIEWYTDALRRMLLQETASYAIGSYGSQVKDGCLLLSPDVDQFYTNGGPGPYSLLHLADADDNASESAYREWMKVGITFTGNLDEGYIGHKYNESDYTDMVVNWSDNTGKEIKDRMRFIFTTEKNSDPTGATSAEGLEGMRLYPLNDDEINVGIGDFFAASDEPSERLDVVTGKVRIRELPDAPNEMPGEEKFVVVDPDGVLGWRFSECDWVVQNENTVGSGTPHYVSTAHGTSDVCPDRTDLVGIGAVPTSAKLQVYSDMTTDATPATGASIELVTTTSAAANGLTVSVVPSGGALGLAEVAVNGTAVNGSSSTQGLRGIAIVSSSSVSGASVTGTSGEATVTAGTVGNAYALYGDAVSTAGTVSNNHGLYTRAVRGSNAYGVLSYAIQGTNSYGVVGSGSAGTNNYGTFGEGSGGTLNVGAFGRATGTSVTNKAVWGTTVGDTTTNSWAGYFDGKVQITGNLWHNATFIFSDANLKTDVEEVTGEQASELLAQLAPKSYHYNAEQYPYMGFSGASQYGFLAQEVQEVLPQLVSTTHVTEVTDSSGTVLAGAMDVSGVNYVGMIPLLVAGYQAQQERIAQLEETVALCCASGMQQQGTGGSTEQLGGTQAEQALLGDARKLLIQPNPFNEATTLYYTLERAGRMQLMANSADGKQLRVLHEANMEAGQYQYEWNTTDLSPGMYYVTLLLDGEPIVKKAVNTGSR